MSGAAAEKTIKLDGRDFAQELEERQELDRRASGLADQMVVGIPAGTWDFRKNVIRAVMSPCIALAAFLFTREWLAWWWGWALKYFFLIAALVLLLWQWISGPQVSISLGRVVRRMREIDRRHFIVLISELGRSQDEASAYAIFACHMLVYFYFVPSDAMDWPSWKSVMPVDVEWWAAPGSCSTEGILAAILRTRLLEAVPQEFTKGILAQIRHRAQAAMMRSIQSGQERPPTREEAARIAEFIEAAAERGKGPMIGIGQLVKRFLKVSEGG